MPVFGPIVIVNEDNQSYSWCRINLDENGVIDSLFLAPATLDGECPLDEQYVQSNFSSFTAVPTGRLDPAQLPATRLRVIHDFILSNEDDFNTYFLISLNERLNRIRFRVTTTNPEPQPSMPEPYNVADNSFGTAAIQMPGKAKKHFDLMDRAYYAPLCHQDVVEIRQNFAAQNQRRLDEINRRRLEAEAEQRRQEEERLRIEAEQRRLEAERLQLARETLMINPLQDGAIRQGVVDENARADLIINPFLTQWHTLKSDALSFANSPNRTYSYVLAGMVFGIAEEDSSIDYQYFDTAIRVFRDYFREPTTQEQMTFMRSLLVLEWLLHQREYPADAVRIEAIAHYLQQEIGDLVTAEHPELYSATTPGYQRVCTLYKMVLLLPEGATKEDFLTDLQYFTIDQALITNYPFLEDQKAYLYQQLNCYTLKQKINTLYPGPRAISLAPESRDSLQVLALLYRARGFNPRLRQSLINALSHIQLQPHNILFTNMGDDELNQELQNRIGRINTVQTLKDLVSEETALVIIDQLGPDRRSELVNELVGRVTDERRTAVRDTSVTPANLHAMVTSTQVAFPDPNAMHSSDFEKALLNRYVLANNNLEAFENQSYLQRHRSLLNKLNSSPLGQAIVRQLDALTVGSHSYSPYYSGSGEKLNRALRRLHTVLDPVKPLQDDQVAEYQRRIHEHLVVDLFTPGEDHNHPLYAIFNQHRLLPWFHANNAPARSALAISFAYVKEELDALIATENRHASVAALLEQLKTLEEASHTIWPWNYGSQAKLHAILNAIIELRQTPTVEFNKDNLIAQIEDNYSLLHRALNQHRLFTITTDTSTMNAVRAGITLDRAP